MSEWSPNCPWLFSLEGESVGLIYSRTGQVVVQYALIKLGSQSKHSDNDSMIGYVNARDVSSLKVNNLYDSFPCDTEKKTMKWFSKSIIMQRGLSRMLPKVILP